MPDVPSVDTFPGQGVGNVVGSVVTERGDVPARRTRTLRRQSAVVFGHAELAGRMSGGPWQQGSSERELETVVSALTQGLAAVRLASGIGAAESPEVVVEAPGVEVPV